MTVGRKTAIIVSASSDIGSAMARRWLREGWHVSGTYRTETDQTRSLESDGLNAVHCDLSSPDSIAAACETLRNLCPEWDVLVLCPGTQEPIGDFNETSFEEWSESIQVNFTSQLGIVHGLLPTIRDVSDDTPPCVLFFAGGGTNGAVVKYSGYTVSKIALIKMCELLSAEIDRARFAIVGPGWVGTKIHRETLDAGERAGANLALTQKKLAGDELTLMEDVLDCCDWIIQSPSEIVDGRNFSVVYDRWGDPELEELLQSSPDMYKLRRQGNDLLVRRSKSE